MNTRVSGEAAGMYARPEGAEASVGRPTGVAFGRLGGGASSGVAPGGGTGPFAGLPAGTEGAPAGRRGPSTVLPTGVAAGTASRRPAGSVTTGLPARGRRPSWAAVELEAGETDREPHPEHGRPAGTGERTPVAAGPVVFDRPGSGTAAAPGAVPPAPPGAGTGAAPGLLDGVRRWLADRGAEPTPARVAQALRDQGRVLGDAEVLGAAEQLRSELVGSGPLEPLLADPAVTDVLVSAPDRVWVDRGGGLELTPVSFPDAAAVRRLAQRLAGVAGRRLDDARPWVDARLPDGTRLHAVLPPVAVGCTCLSLRVVRPRAFTLGELAAAGTVPPGGDGVLRALVHARLSFLVSGGTGTGKTTLLSALLGLVGPGERVVLAEDSAELRPDHPHVVRLETRPANQEGAGRVSLEDLVRQALRMRPDRLVVGEVRGPEVVHLLAALNTGHEGGCGTVHANAAADVPARLEALGTAAGLDRAALHSQLAAALSVVLHLVRDRAGRRRIAEVHVLERDPSGLVRTVPALRWGPEAFVAERGWARLRELLRGDRLPAEVPAGEVCR